MKISSREFEDPKWKYKKRNFEKSVHKVVLKVLQNVVLQK